MVGMIQVSFLFLVVLFAIVLESVQPISALLRVEPRFWKDVSDAIDPVHEWEFGRNIKVDAQ